MEELFDDTFVTDSSLLLMMVSMRYLLGSAEHAPACFGGREHTACMQVVKVQAPTAPGDFGMWETGTGTVGMRERTRGIVGRNRKAHEEISL